MWFKLVGQIESVEVIAIGHRIRELARLNKFYGKARWRKLKGIAVVELPGDELFKAEVHWYECDGIGRRRLKVKRELE